MGFIQTEHYRIDVTCGQIHGFCLSSFVGQVNTFGNLYGKHKSLDPQLLLHEE